MRVIVDAGLCQAYGNCVGAAPEVFDLDDARGYAIVLRADPPPELHRAVEQAVQLCPVRAIRTVADDEPTG